MDHTKTTDKKLEQAKYGKEAVVKNSLSGEELTLESTEFQALTAALGGGGGGGSEERD